MRTCIYARKSTHKRGQKETIENQIKICKTKADELKLDIVDIKQDTGTGTDDLNRPEVKQLIEDAINGHYECVIMKGISRLYRDTEKGLGLIKLLDRNGIRVITVEEMFDSGNDDCRTGTGKLDLSKITMYLMFSEMESKKLADRIKYTQMEKARQGEWNHANNTPYGFDFDSGTKKLKINTLEAEIVKLIFKLYTNGVGIRSISHYLNGDNEKSVVYKTPKKSKLWNQYTVNFILKNQAYIGSVVYNKRSKKERTYKHPELFGKEKGDLWVGNDYNDESKWIVCEDAHESIIEKDVFVSAQEILSAKATRKGIKSNVGLLAGIAKCGKCGSGLTFKRGNRDSTGRVKSYDNYYCMNYIKYGTRGCTSHHVRSEELEDFVINHLEQFLDSEFLEQVVKNHKAANADKPDKSLAEKIRIENEIKKLAEKTEKLLEKNLDGDISDQQFGLMNRKFTEELKVLSDKLIEVNLNLEKSNDNDHKENLFRKNVHRLKDIRNYTKEQKRYVLLDLVEKATWYEDGTIDFVYKF